MLYLDAFYGLAGAACYWWYPVGLPIVARSFVIDIGFRLVQAAYTRLPGLARWLSTDYLNLLQLTSSCYSAYHLAKLSYVLPDHSLLLILVKVGSALFSGSTYLTTMVMGAYYLIVFSLKAWFWAELRPIQHQLISYAHLLRISTEAEIQAGELIDWLNANKALLLVKLDEILASVNQRTTLQQLEQLAPARCAGLQNSIAETQHHEAFSVPEACAVCLAQFDPKSLHRTLPCGHSFHVGCIDEWCNLRFSCPICKTPLAPSEPTEATGVRLTTVVNGLANVFRP
jgi:hypothetical protein